MRNIMMEVNRVVRQYIKKAMLQKEIMDSFAEEQGVWGQTIPGGTKTDMGQGFPGQWNTNEEDLAGKSEEVKS